MRIVCLICLIVSSLLEAGLDVNQPSFSNIGLSLPPSSINKYVHVIVGTLSAQSNFEARQSIRNTWRTLARNGSLEHYFIIGNDFCNLPLDDRISPYGCEELIITLPTTESIQTSYYSAEKKCHHIWFRGFTFVTHHKVVIRSLNIVTEALQALDLVRLHLLDTRTQEIVVSAVLKSSSVNKTSTQIIISKAVEPFVLPKGFEGQVIMEHLVSSPTIDCCTVWSNGSGVFTFLQLIEKRNEKPVPFFNDSCSPVSMTFDIYDVSGLKKHIELRAARQNKWDSSVALLKSKLKAEHQEKKDILFVNVQDVYRTLSKKLLLFFLWAYKYKNFTYLVKTDDDSFINLNKLQTELSYVERMAKKSHGFPRPRLWWWGSFRENWAVGVSGKWREDNYRSLTYPTFPCGAGYVLSYGVVAFLAENANVLRTDFQGEDVSVGIWLAGVNLIQHCPSAVIRDADTCSRRDLFWSDEHDDICDVCSGYQYPTWSCDHTCQPCAVNRAQLTVPQMYETWKVFKKCSNLCRCPS